jgi:hypothetical protein
MNMARILMGGLAAGLVINISEATLNVAVLGDDWAQVMTALGKPSEFTGGQIALFNVMGFALGIATVWLYAAIRPRYGAGPKTAVCAGSATWTISMLLPSIGQAAMNLFPPNLIAIGLVWSLVEMIVAGLVGGKLYREEAPAAIRAHAA